jgi:hypothetical protein
MNGGAKPCHRFAKDRRIGSLQQLRTERLEGSGHSVVGTLIDPTHSGKRV